MIRFLLLLSLVMYIISEVGVYVIPTSLILLPIWIALGIFVFTVSTIILLGLTGSKVKVKFKG